MKAILCAVFDVWSEWAKPVAKEHFFHKNEQTFRTEPDANKVINS